VLFYKWLIAPLFPGGCLLGCYFFLFLILAKATPLLPFHNESACILESLAPSIGRLVLLRLRLLRRGHSLGRRWLSNWNNLILIALLLTTRVLLKSS